MTTTKAPTPTIAAVESKIVTVLLWLPRLLWAAVMKAVGGIVGIKNLIATYKLYILAAVAFLIIGGVAIHLVHMHNPQIAASPKTVTVTIPVVDTKTSAQIALISAQLDTIQKTLAKQGAPAVATPIAVAPAAAQPETPAPVKHKAVPKKAASTSGWFQ